MTEKELFNLKKNLVRLQQEAINRHGGDYECEECEEIQNVINLVDVL